MSATVWLFGCLVLLSLCSCEETSKTFQFSKAAVAADNAICSRIGADILEINGGNAVDAAVSTALCLGVLQPFASGIGGGGVALVYLSETQNSEVFDFREIAPGAASTNMFVSDPLASETGGKAIAVPGEVAGLWQMWSRYGRVPWEDLVEPVIPLAEKSVVGPLLAETIQEKKASILGFPGLRGVFAPGGVLLVEGDMVYQPALANTLRAIQEDPFNFYFGQVAKNLVADIKNATGIITEQDFSYYWNNGVHVRRPVSSYFQGYKVLGAGPPYTGGLITAMTLNLIEPYDFGLMTNESSLAQHYLIEAWKWAYADRMAIGDPSFDDMQPVIEAMMSKEHASVLRRQFNPDTTYPPNHYSDLVPTEASINDHGTSHLSVIDSDGNVVALTSTVNLSFGSKILSPSTGVVLNNEMDDFSTPNQTNYFGQPPSEANYILPYKKPISSMCPTLVMRNGLPYISIGGSGGTKIPTATIQSLLGILVWGEEVGQAIGNPRCHNQNSGDTRVEVDYSSDFVAFLKQTNHIIDVNPDTLAAVQGIVVNPSGGLSAASDWRKQGLPAGY